MRSKTCRPNPTTVLETMRIKIPNPVSFFTAIQYTPSALKATFTHRFLIASNSISACPAVCLADIIPSTTPAARGRRTNSLQPRETDREPVVLSILWLISHSSPRRQNTEISVGVISKLALEISMPELESIYSYMRFCGRPHKHIQLVAASRITKSLDLGMTLRARVFVCSNMAFSGVFTPVTMLHSHA